MAHQQSPSCCSGNNSKIIYEYIDPVCGMQVAETSEHYFDYQDIRYLFCSAGCQQKFSAHPENYLNVIKLSKMHHLAALKKSSKSSQVAAILRKKNSQLQKHLLVVLQNLMHLRQVHVVIIKLNYSRLNQK